MSKGNKSLHDSSKGFIDPNQWHDLEELLGKPETNGQLADDNDHKITLMDVVDTGITGIVIILILAHVGVIGILVLVVLVKLVTNN